MHENDNKTETNGAKPANIRLSGNALSSLNEAGYVAKQTI